MKPEGGEITLPLSPSNGEGEKEEIQTGSYGEEITIGSYIEGGEEVEISTETDGDGEEVSGFCREEEIKTAEDEEEIKTVKEGGEEEIKSVDGKGEEEHKARKPSSLAANYRQSRATIMKKAKELSTLCDIPVCVAILSPKDGTTETWPESRCEVKKIWNASLKNIQIHDDRWTLCETNARSSLPLKIVDDHDEIVNALNSTLASTERVISYWQQRQKENVENCSNIIDQEKNLDGQKTKKKSDEQKRKRERPE